MLRRAALFILSLGCSSEPSGPPVTCSDVTFDSSNGSCTFTANTPCDDGSFYFIDCQDDSTCSCVKNTDMPISVIVSSKPFGFCASIDASSLHDIAAKCGWNVNP